MDFGTDRRPLEPFAPARRTTAVFAVPMLFAAVLGLLAPPSPASILRGGGKSGYENFSFLRPSRQYWSVFHLDTWQSLGTESRLSFDLNWAKGNAPRSVNRIGLLAIALNGFRIGRWKGSAIAGDSAFRFTNIRNGFANAVYLDVYVRGGRLAVSGPRSEIAVYGGRISRIEGFTGRSFEVTPQSVIGFQSRIPIGEALSIGAGALRTWNEADDLGAPVTKDTNILLLDSEVGLARDLTWLTELRVSDFRKASGGHRSRDTSLRFGTIYDGETTHFEANYRHAGPGYRFVSASYQSERNQREFFALGRVSPANWLTVFGNAGGSTDAKDGQLSVIPTQESKGLVGMTIAPGRGLALHLFADSYRRRPASAAAASSDFSLSSLFGELRYGDARMNGYLRFRRFSFDDRRHPESAYDQLTATAGFYRTLAEGFIFYLEGEGERRRLAIDAEETQLRTKAGFHFDPVPSFSLWGEGSFIRTLAASGLPGRNDLAAYAGMSLSFPRGLRAFIDLHYDRMFEFDDGFAAPAGLRLQVRVSKSFNWGEPARILGKGAWAEGGGIGSVSGFVFEDANGNGQVDPGEKGLPKFALKLEDGSAVETQADGSFRFIRVAAGEHVVSLDVRHIPIEYNILGPAEQRTAVAPRAETRLNFRVIAGARLSGRVVFDENGDGEADGLERGQADVLVYLLPGGEINTFTDASGNFEFQNLDPGEYTIAIDDLTLPEGCAIVPPTAYQRTVSPGEDLSGLTFLIKEKITFVKLPIKAIPAAPAARTPAKPKSVLPAGAGRIDAIVVKGDGGGFAVQAGSFWSQENAAELQRALSRSYKGVTVTEYSKAGETVYRVRIKASSKPAALQIVRALAQEAPVATGSGLTARKK